MILLSSYVGKKSFFFGGEEELTHESDDGGKWASARPVKRIAFVQGLETKPSVWGRRLLAWTAKRVMLTVPSVFR
jgi:hypothetical protein